MKNTIVKSPVQEKPIYTAADRCDRCNARAQSVITKEDLLLLFCGHHTRKYELALTTAGFAITAISNEE